MRTYRRAGIVTPVASNFSKDIKQMGRWYIYGIRDEYNPEGKTETLDQASSAITSYSDNTFGLGYAFSLGLVRARRVAFERVWDDGMLTGYLGPSSHMTALFDIEPRDGFLPKTWDLVFEVLWNCHDDLVPIRGGISTVLGVFRVGQTAPLFATKDELVFWHVKTRELEFQRQRLTDMLKRRWEDEKTSRYGRS